MKLHACYCSKSVAEVLIGCGMEDKVMVLDGVVQSDQLVILEAHLEKDCSFKERSISFIRQQNKSMIHESKAILLGQSIGQALSLTSENTVLNGIKRIDHETMIPDAPNLENYNESSQIKIFTGNMSLHMLQF